MDEQEIFYTIALTRIGWFNIPTALLLYQKLGGGKAVYEHRNDITDVIPDGTPHLLEALKDWDEPLRRAAAEMEFISRHGIQAITYNDDRYPQRMKECADAPIILYYKGNATLNPERVINIVGTRRCTTYGQDLIQKIVTDLRRLCPGILIMSGLAYGVDVNAHQQALANGLDTIGVLAHGLDYIYPRTHEKIAAEMVQHGGLLTEFMSGTNADKINFVRRNRIVAGMSDATVLIESAAHGGGLITCDIARSYGRDVFATPGPIGACFSEGCNNLIRDNGAALITSAQDLVNAMGWQQAAILDKAQHDGIERTLFPQLSEDEEHLVRLLQDTNDLPINTLSVQSDMAIGKVTSVLFQLEMKGVIRTMAGGIYHLLKL